MGALAPQTAKRVYRTLQPAVELRGHLPVHLAGVLDQGERGQGCSTHQDDPLEQVWNRNWIRLKLEHMVDRVCYESSLAGPLWDKCFLCQLFKLFKNF